MAAQRADKTEIKATQHASGQARSLAETMPRLILEARRIAATVIHGLHGRKRAGPGENFWQYRRFLSGEPARRVDWRRSARDEHLYVREQEWEAAHTVWIWPDRSPSMVFTSPLGAGSKLDRTLVIGFALAEVLVQAGERVGMPGLMRPTGSRNVLDKMANAIVHDVTERASLPPSSRPRRSPRSWWSRTSGARSPTSARPSRSSSSTGAHGHVVQVVDPAEETFPYSGRVEFIEPEGGGLHHRRTRRGLARRLRGPRRAPPRRDPRRDRQARLELRHPPHRPSGDRTAAGAARPHGRAAARRRHGRRAWPCPDSAGGTHDGSSARLRAAAGAARAVEPAGPVVAVAAHSAAAAPHRFPADTAPVRHHAEGRDAAAHAVVAHAAAADAGRRSSSSPPPVRCGIRRSRPRTRRRRSRS